MKTLIQEIQTIIENAFDKAGYNNSNISIVPCSIASMGDFQCNNVLAMAKQYGENPRAIAEKVLKNVAESKVIQEISIAGPGFINIKINDNFLENYIPNYLANIDEKLDIDNRRIVIDYAGPNAAKPLHVGHLRSAIIGESIKRICKMVGNEVIGDIHLGDWGLQMGMVISELHRRQPDLPYFNENYTGDYPQESPITKKDLETLYPEANAKAKANEDMMNEAKLATLQLQQGRRGYVALWKHIMNISKEDLKKQYDFLNINFDLWLGESDTKKYYEEIIPEIERKGLAHISEGALVINVDRPDDKIDVPPFILKKTDGAVLYSTTDLAAIVQRQREIDPDRIIYVVDNRQEMHFIQLFRCINKIGVLSRPIQLDFVGFGTMNGKDGKPYKTRDGGVMQLKSLIDEVRAKAYEKVQIAKAGDKSYTEDEMKNISDAVAISALKFADLSIFRAKDYIFDVDKFTSFEGKTGPYILYTITRAKSILRKASDDKNCFKMECCPRDLILTLIDLQEEIKKAYVELAPSYLCDYVYKVANMFNSFYNSCNIINESDETKKYTWLNLTKYTLGVMEKVANLLGIKTLNKM